MTVRQYIKNLSDKPEVPTFIKAHVRSFVDSDAELWLQLRKAAMSNLVAPGRDWTALDFRREFTNKPDFDSARMWVAEPVVTTEPTNIVATICLSIDPSTSVAIIRWLMVHPTFQRQGLATHLLALAESAAWQSNCLSIRLDTLSSWQAACAVYEAAGYARQ